MIMSLEIDRAYFKIVNSDFMQENMSRFYQGMAGIKFS
jgi:hypothetical protein